MHTHTRELRRSRTYKAMVTSFLPKTFSPETLRHMSRSRFSRRKAPVSRTSTRGPQDIPIAD